MYQENGSLDESSSMHGSGFSQAEDAFSQTHFSTEEQSYPHNDVAALEMELQHQLQIEHCFTNKNAGDIQSANWHAFNAQNGHYHQNYAADLDHIFAAKASFADAPDLLTIFPPPPSLLPNFPQKSPAFSASLLPLNLPPQLFQSLPHLFTNGGDEREANEGLYQNGNGDFEFTAGENGDGSRDSKQHSTEKHRRVVMKDKYEALKALIPSPTKIDRASIVADAIGYIKELKRTVGELKGLIERKRCATERERLKRPKVEQVDEMDGSSSLRSSWLRRKSKNTEVDVRIVDDEITVKLVQQKRINCLLFVSKVLDDLQLDLQHVAGGLIGDYYSYLFNSKICEGSTVYASAVANTLIEVVDKQYSAVPPTNTY